MNGNRAVLTAAILVSLVMGWLSSGTLTPLNLTSNRPVVAEEDGGYLHNIDHPLHEGAFLMLDGYPLEVWASSYHVRRILYFWVAYPWMKAFGFNWGGFLANLFMTAVVLVVLARWARARWGASTANWVVCMAATFPGTYYWIGLPYCYAFISPGSLLAWMGAVHLTEHVASRSFLACFWMSVAIGILFLGYDFGLFFGGALAIWLLTQRQWKLAPAMVAGLSLPVILWMLWLRGRWGIPWTAPNTAPLSISLNSYVNFHPGYLQDLWRNLRLIPSDLPQVWLFSTFVFLPILGTAARVLLQKDPDARIRIEDYVAVMCVVTVLFLAATPTPDGRRSDWARQGFKGAWIARLYHPLFIAYLGWFAALHSSGQLTAVRRKVLSALALLVIVGQTWTVLGTILESRLSAELYTRYYMHGSPGNFLRHLDQFGRRPRGL